MSNSIKRVPRPLGLTLASRNYQIQSTPDNYDILVDRILVSYISNNFTLNSKQYNIQELGHYLNIPQEQILIKINTASNTLANIISKDNLEETTRAIFSFALNGCLNDKAYIHKQYSLLAKSQGEAYKPFISAEVNHILASSLKATQNMMQLLTTLQGGKGTSINIFNTNQSSTTNQYLTTTEALKILTESDAKTLALPMSERYKELAEENGVFEVVEVRANGAEENALIRVGAMEPIGDKALLPSLEYRMEERGLEADDGMPNRE